MTAARPAARPHGPVLTPQVVLHDRANLVVLPVMGCMVLAGLMGYIDTMLVRLCRMLRHSVHCPSLCNLWIFPGPSSASQLQTSAWSAGHQGLCRLHRG